MTDQNRPNDDTHDEAGDTRGQQGRYLTTAQGARLRDTDRSLKAGRRGPILLQDHHLREKITHFDHERIPERVVHARGAAAHGVFESYGTASSVTRAAFLQHGAVTPTFTRFSTVLGSRGSADTVRDTRGFATKFYTGRGPSIWWVTTFRCSSSRTASSSPMSFMLRSPILIGRYRRRSRPMTHSGISSHCTPRPSTTPCGICRTVEFLDPSE